MVLTVYVLFSLSCYFIAHEHYITELKINRAKKLLRETHLSISEIAEKVGFSDTGYFNKLFKAKTGASPSKYRFDYRQRV